MERKNLPEEAGANILRWAGHVERLEDEKLQKEQIPRCWRENEGEEMGGLQMSRLGGSLAHNFYCDVNNPPFAGHVIIQMY